MPFASCTEQKSFGQQQTGNSYVAGICRSRRVARRRLRLPRRQIRSNCRVTTWQRLPWLKYALSLRQHGSCLKQTVSHDPQPLVAYGASRRVLLVSYPNLFVRLDTERQLCYDVSEREEKGQGDEQ